MNPRARKALDGIADEQGRNPIREADFQGHRWTYIPDGPLQEFAGRSPNVRKPFGKLWMAQADDVSAIAYGLGFKNPRKDSIHVGILNCPALEPLVVVTNGRAKCPHLLPGR